MARRCGPNRIFKSKCTKHHMLGPIFEVPMSKNGTRLWREAHFQVKKHKIRSNFRSSDVEKLNTAVARSTLVFQNAKKKLKGSDHFLKLRCRKICQLVS